MSWYTAHHSPYVVLSSKILYKKIRKRDSTRSIVIGASEVENKNAKRNPAISRQ